MKDYTPIGICRGVLAGDSISPDLRIRWYGRAQGFVLPEQDARDSRKPNLLRDDFDFRILIPRVCGKIDSPDQGKFSELPLPPPCCSESGFIFGWEQSCSGQIALVRSQWCNYCATPTQSPLSGEVQLRHVLPRCAVGRQGWPAVAVRVVRDPSKPRHKPIAERHVLSLGIAERKRQYCRCPLPELRSVRRRSSLDQHLQWSKWIAARQRLDRCSSPDATVLVRRPEPP